MYVCPPSHFSVLTLMLGVRILSEQLIIFVASEAGKTFKLVLEIRFLISIITSSNSLSPVVSFPKMTYLYLSKFALSESTILLEAHEVIVAMIMIVAIKCFMLM